MSSISSSPVYDVLAAHQSEQVNWRYQPVIQEFLRWRDIFNVEFKLELTPTAFRVGGANSNCYGHFRPSPNDFGLPREIAFNEHHLLTRLASDEFWKALGTLLHELLHAWQFDHGRPSLRNHHNKQLREKAAALGLLMSASGVTTYAPASPFLDLLKQHGVRTPDLPGVTFAGSVPVRPGSKLKLWRCLCTNVRVGVADFRAQCLKCGAAFNRQN